MTWNRASAQSDFNYVLFVTLPGYINSGLRVAVSRYLYATLLVMYVPGPVKAQRLQRLQKFWPSHHWSETLASMLASFNI